MRNRFYFENWKIEEKDFRVCCRKKENEIHMQHQALRVSAKKKMMANGVKNPDKRRDVLTKSGKKREQILIRRLSPRLSEAFERGRWKTTHDLLFLFFDSRINSPPASC